MKLRQRYITLEIIEEAKKKGFIISENVKPFDKPSYFLINEGTDEIYNIAIVNPDEIEILYEKHIDDNDSGYLTYKNK